MHVVATAGHVDHGKSTLVLALTGMDPDRFAEEKERGLTIDLGFAWTTLPSGREVGFVDVPGHVRFVKNMLAGVGAVDACVFVVDAAEGWKPQSEEHLRILELLGTRHGVLALTKVASLADDDERELARLAVADHIAGTFLDGAEIVGVDAVAGCGVDDLRSAIDRLLARTPNAADHGRPRLWIDRSFAVKGAGAVVTGTLTGGALHAGEELVVLPAGRRGRVRRLHTHAAAIDAATPGRRLAVNLSGVSHHDVARGHAVVRDGQWTPTAAFDASFTVLASLGHDVGRRGAYHAYVGSGEHAVRIRVLGAASIEPGGTARVRVHLPVALPLAAGDRFVLRESGRQETVGGGEVLDVAPVLRRTRPARPVLAEDPPTAGRASPAGPPTPSPDHPYLAALTASPYAPPTPSEAGVDPGEARALVRAGLAVERDGVWFAASAVDGAARTVAQLLAAKPSGVTASEVREALGTTRKYVLPLLGHLDATGVTRRRGDVRVGGPRLP
jgi:selenocysteine-specific elongation factor